MRLAVLPGIILSAWLLTACGVRAHICSVLREPVLYTDSEAADLVLGMLLHTESSISFRITEGNPDVWIRQAADTHVLARTMLQTVTWSRNGDTVSIQADYALSADALRRRKEMLADTSVLWARETASESDAVRVLLAHDLLCRTCEYADDVPECHSAGGALLLHRAACDGYAEAFALLMETAGIPVLIVTGKTADAEGRTENHAWNMVQLGGAWYQLDCTWDDTGTVPAHTYFLCNDDSMYPTHLWDTEKYPPALGGGYRYERIAADMAAQIRKDGA